MGCALVLLRRTEEGKNVLEEFRRRCLTDGDLYSLVGCDPIFGVSKILEGNIGEGIRLIREAILRREKDDYRTAADWYRLTLGEVYLQIIGGNEKLPIPTLLKNFSLKFPDGLLAKELAQRAVVRTAGNHFRARQ